MPYTTTTNATTLKLLNIESLPDYLEAASAYERQWITNNAFTATPKQVLIVPAADGAITKVLAGYTPETPITALSLLPEQLPQGNYQLECDEDPAWQRLALIGWGLASYRFNRYKTVHLPKAKLYLPDIHKSEVEAQLEASLLVRDLINTPPVDMGPQHIADQLQQCAQAFGAQFTATSGDQLANEFPAVHAVGKASDYPPRLLTMEWGQAEHPLVALVGKGVSFDTGGLNIKTSSRMLRMKKDMGGAAHVIALARLIMRQRLPVRLLVVIPAVENMIAGNSYRPGDVVHTRRGLTIEIINTDAEGRVILADGLQLASEAEPDLIIDFATLTGAARVALGPDVPPLFSNRSELAAELYAIGNKHADNLWPMPLFSGYERFLKSETADITNNPPTSFAGAICAALFLQRFVDDTIPWVHLDVYGWNDSNLPGRPQGGEAQGLRAVYHWLKKRYC